jgi:DNA-directed RNA polymerase specialized sigma24 family protein
MNKIFEKLYVPLASFIEEIIGDHEEAKDMAVEIFRSYRDEIERYEEVEDLTEIRKILLKIARIKSFIFLIKRIQQQDAVEVFLQRSQDFEASKEEAMIEEEVRQLLEKERGKLSIIQNKVLSLLMLKMRSTEAARIMNISPSTFRNTKRAVLKKLKKVFDDGRFIVIVILLLLIVKACSR